MKVALAIPYRATDHTRQFAYEHTLEYLSRMFPWYHINVFDSGHTPFNRAASRNLAINSNSEADVVVLCDADSIPEENVLREAIFGAQVDGLCHFPFNKVNDITKEHTRRVGQVPLKWLRIQQTYGPSAGGCWVVRPETWWKAGGMDERLLFWGEEDRQFLVCINTFLGGPVFHEGYLYCLWHNRAGVGRTPEDTEVFNRYANLEGNPIGLQKYINERGSYQWASSSS